MESLEILAPRGRRGPKDNQAPLEWQDLMVLMGKKVPTDLPDKLELQDHLER